MIIYPGDRIAFLGDSITAFGWHTVSGGFVDQVNANWGQAAPRVTRSRVVGPRRARVTGRTARTMPAVPARKRVTITTHGVAGNTVAQIDARVNADIVALVPKPTVVIVEAGINDVVTGVAIGVATAAISAVLTKLTTGIPGVRVAWLGCICYGESSGDDASYNTAIGAVESAISAACTTFGQQYINARTPTRTYLAANNWGGANVSSGVLTSDAVHPNVTGQLLMATAAIGVCQVQP